MSGAREGASFFLKEPPVAVDYDQHAIDRYLKVAEQLGCNTVIRKGEIPVSEEDKKLADGIFASFPGGKTIIAVNPMAKWKTKLWKPDKFSQLAEKLQKEIDCRIIFTGSVQDRPIIEDIIKQTGGKAGSNYKPCRQHNLKRACISLFRMLGSYMHRHGTHAHCCGNELQGSCPFRSDCPSAHRPLWKRP